MNTVKTCNLTSKDSYSAMLSDCRAAMERLRAPEDATREYLDRVAGVLDGLVEHLGDGSEVRYSVSTRFKKAFLKIEARGERFDPADGIVVDMSTIEESELQPLLRQDKEAGITPEMLFGRVCYKAHLAESDAPISLVDAISIIMNHL